MNTCTIAIIAPRMNRRAPERPALQDDPVSDELVESTLVASRALLGVVARSLSEALETISLPQFRVLVVLAGVEALRIGALAARMNANASTFSRTIDRMVAHGWVDRAASSSSRREIMIRITDKGRHVVDDVTERRRAELAAILGRLDPAQRAMVASVLEIFATAADEPSSRALLTLGL